MSHKLLKWPHSNWNRPYPAWHSTIHRVSLMLSQLLPLISAYYANEWIVTLSWVRRSAQGAIEIYKQQHLNRPSLGRIPRGNYSSIRLCSREDNCFKDRFNCFVGRLVTYWRCQMRLTWRSCRWVRLLDPYCGLPRSGDMLWRLITWSNICSQRNVFVACRGFKRGLIHALCPPL